MARVEDAIFLFVDDGGVHEFHLIFQILNPYGAGRKELEIKGHDDKNTRRDLKKKSCIENSPSKPALDIRHPWVPYTLPTDSSVISVTAGIR